MGGMTDPAAFFRILQVSARPWTQILRVVFPVRLGEDRKKRGFTCPQCVGSVSVVLTLSRKCSPFNPPNKLGKVASLPQCKWGN